MDSERSSGGLAPVDQVDIEAGLEQRLDHGAVGLEVEDVRLVDQRVDDEDGNAVLLLRHRLVVEEFEFVLLVNDLAGRLPDVDVLDGFGALGHDLRLLGRSAVASQACRCTFSAVAKGCSLLVFDVLEHAVEFLLDGVLAALEFDEAVTDFDDIAFGRKAQRVERLLGGLVGLFLKLEDVADGLAGHLGEGGRRHDLL